MGPRISAAHPEWHSVALQEAEWIALMHIIQENVNESDGMVQARAERKKGDTVKMLPECLKKKRKNMFTAA